MSTSISLLDPISAPQSWDTVVVGGVNSPGLAIVGDWKRTHDWQIKKGKGALGATITFVQRPPAEGQITFQLWDNGNLNTGHNHFQEWDQFVPFLKYDPTKKAVQGVDIFHPSLDNIDVHSVVTTKIGNLVHKGEGLYEVVVDFLEFFPPPKKNAASTPDGSKSFVADSGKKLIPGDTPQSAPDALDQEVGKLLTQAQQP